MGINKPIITITAKIMKHKGLSGKCITFGVNGIDGSYRKVEALLKKAGYPYTKIGPDELKLDALTQYGRTIHQSVFFKMLGFSTVESIDLFPNESPDHIFDLNEPINRDWEGNYDLVWDGGTSEHVFNVPECLSNAVKLLKIGGRVVHYVPVSGYIDHGFYQFSPTFFFDFYGCNGFTEMEAVLIELPALKRASFYHYDSNRSFSPAFNKKTVICFFTARKTGETARVKIPTQHYYSRGTSGNHPGKSKIRETISKLETTFPFLFQLFLQADRLIKTMRTRMKSRFHA